MFPVAPATAEARRGALVGAAERRIPTNPIQALLSGEAHHAAHHGGLSCRFGLLLAA